jgi:hypothetical protein
MDVGVVPTMVELGGDGHGEGGREWEVYVPIPHNGDGGSNYEELELE